MNATHQDPQWQTLLKEAQEQIRSGNFKAASEQLQQALDLSRKLFGDDSSHTAVTLSELAECYEAQGDEEHADQCYCQVSQILQNRSESSH